VEWASGIPGFSLLAQRQKPILAIPQISTTAGRLKTQSEKTSSHPKILMLINYLDAGNLGAICDSKADQSSKEIDPRATTAQETDFI